MIPEAEISAPAGRVKEGGLLEMGDLSLGAGANLIFGEWALSLPGVGNLTGMEFPGKRKAGPTVGDDALAGLGVAEGGPENKIDVIEGLS